MNGIGSHYYGKKNRTEVTDWCDHCGRRATLRSYDTTECICLLFIPIIPIGKWRIVRECPLCTMHQRLRRKHVDALIQEAVDDAAKNLREHPDNPDGAAEAVGTCLGLGRPDTAEEILKLLQRQFPSDARVLMAEGAIRSQQGRTVEAERCLRRAVEISPDDPVAHYALGELLLDEGKPAEGIALLEKVVKTAPDLVDAGNLLMGVYESDGNWTELVGVMEEVARIDPGNLEHKPFVKLLKKARRKAGVAV